MSQKPSSSPSPFLNNLDRSRPRSNSVIRLMSSQNPSSSSPTQQGKNFKRSMSVSEGLHVRLPTLHHTETEPFPYSPVTQQTTNNICPSESNWANKYEDFDIGKPIGYGSSAVVYEAIYKPLKKRVAVKMIDLDMFERNQIDELRRETALMALSKHPNVLRVYGSFVNGSKLYIVTPYLAAGSCLDIMKTTFPDGLDEVSIATILRQALEGLIYLHKNGHIHRDVKAGNLLMDQQGTVLLADFGVSSSLAENGDVRKTFVGTPCWMAPEVMEQAGYDYKADIWSFGITSLELATGHAPFAKFPPMKVLMMTLSNAPPTLDREGGKHKYSRAFKDMIDSCLQKDPNKRPSAEKLIQHPFFKQAKKRDTLVKSILAHVLPLDQRPHKKVPQKHISFESTEQWDFDTQSDDESNNDQDKNGSDSAAAAAAKQAALPVITTTPAATTVTDKNNIPSTPLERSKSMVQFEECPKPVYVDKIKSTNASPATETSTEQPPPPIKKHISFGDAVIRDPPVRSIMSPVVESPNPVHSPLHNATFANMDAVAATPTAYAPPTLSSAPTSKKSRFVIEDSTPAPPHTSTSISPLSDSPISPSNASPSDSNNGVGLGISTTQSVAAAAAAAANNANTIPGASSTTLTPTAAANVAAVAAAAANISSNNNTLQEGNEFKKGRFSVNQTPVRSNTPALEEAPTSNSSPGSQPHGLSEKSTPHPPSDLKSISMSRAASQDSFQERKSRFEVKHSNNSGPSMNMAASVASTPIEPSTPLQSLPLTRENSNASALSRDSSINNKISRFSIEKPEAVGPYCELPAAVASAMSPECRKKGRFELTGGSNTPSDALKDKEHLESPQSTVGPSPAISPCNSLQRGQAHRILDNSMPHMIYAHMESLIKQTEVQKNMLNDLLATMPFMYNQHPPSSGGSILTRTRTVSDTKKPVLSHNEDFYQRAPASSANHAPTTLQQQAPSQQQQQPVSLSTDINNTIEHLQQLLLLSSKEKERLARENESLKREVERLRRSQQQSVPSTTQQTSQSQQQQQQQQQQQSILMKKPSIDSPSSYQQSEKTSLVAPEATDTPANTNQQDKAL